MTAVAQDTRSQTRNRELALQRLAQKLREALYVPPQAHEDPADGGEQAPSAG